MERELKSSSKNYFTINVKISTFYIIGCLFYYWSLARINPHRIKCFKRNDFKCFFMIAEYALISSIIISIAIYIILFYRLKKFHLFNIFIIYIFYYFIDHDSGLVKHGIYNFLIFIFLSFISFIFFCFAKCLYFLSRKLKYRNIYFILLFFPFSPIFLFFNKYKLIHFSCNNWTKGLNDTYIDNTSKDYPCLINIPKNNSCYLDEIGKIFDFSSKFRPTCLDNKLIQSQSKYFLKSIKKYNIKYYNISNKNYFGYPLTNNDKFSIREFGTILSRGKKNLEEELNKNIILMDLFIKNKTKYYPNEAMPEVFVRFKKGSGTIKIKIQKNKTLIKEKEKEKRSGFNNNKLIFKNVILMFFDTISRAHFFRKFPKTVSFLNNFTRYETNLKKKNITVFQFFKYNSVYYYTHPNLRAVYYGSRSNNKGTYFANYFKNQGYILGRATTFCEKMSIIFSYKRSNFKWDHEGISIPCIKGIYNGLFLSKLTSLIKKCLFGKQIFEYALEYLESFFKAYSRYNKMFLLESGEGHEPTGQIVGYLDDIVYNFLSKFYSNNFLSNTTIILFSDHGQHLNGPLYIFKLKDYLYERTLPVLFLIVPNTQELYEESLYEKIKSNEQVFITPYDIYHTLIHIALGLKITKVNTNSLGKYGESLLTPINYTLRYCQSRIYKSQINSDTCNCKINIK